MSVSVLSQLAKSEDRARLGTVVNLAEILVGGRFPGVVSGESICLNVDEDWTQGVVHWLAVLASFSGKLSSSLPILFRNCALYTLKHSDAHRQYNDWQASLHFKLLIIV